jgi:hypothetical protein
MTRFSKIGLTLSGIYLLFVLNAFSRFGESVTPLVGVTLPWSLFAIRICELLYIQSMSITMALMVVSAGFNTVIAYLVGCMLSKWISDDGV